MILTKYNRVSEFMGRSNERTTRLWDNENNNIENQYDESSTNGPSNQRIH